METKLFLEKHKQILELANETLQMAQKRYEKQANTNSKVDEYQGKAKGAG